MDIILFIWYGISHNPSVDVPLVKTIIHCRRIKSEWLLRNTRAINFDSVIYIKI